MVGWETTPDESVAQCVHKNLFSTTIRIKTKPLHSDVQQVVQGVGPSDSRPLFTVEMNLIKASGFLLLESAFKLQFAAISRLLMS